ncbi:putative U-box domain-containing protein 46 [Silene latifolia]|uniref:putative U-box domain-containing protein 46 n=1 Tax=Silene latifolia TaxID=37657 RepID=UPI003D78454E
MLPPSENVTNDPEAEELKNELQRLVLEVIGGNQEYHDGNKVDHGVGNINKAIKALTALKELHLGEKKRQISSLYDHLDVPVEFRCPISKEMMRDPVVLSTGQSTGAIRGIVLDIKQPLKDVPIEIINWYAFEDIPKITTPSTTCSKNSRILLGKKQMKMTMPFFIQDHLKR